MNYRINLYPADLKPKVELLSLTFLVGLCGASLALVLIAGLTMNAAQYNQQQQLQALKSSYQNQSRELKELEKRLQQGPSPDLLEKIRALRQQADDQKLLLEELAARESDKNIGAGRLMSGLANVDAPDLWLTRMQLQSDNIALSGGLTRASALTDWLDRIAQQGTIRDKAFTHASITEGEKQLTFVLRTKMDDVSGESR